MDRDTLVMGLAAVFAGITMLLVVLGFVYQPFVLVVALPFAATTYFMYSHASGRLEERFRRQRARAEAGGFRFGADSDGGRRSAGFGAGPRAGPTEGPGAGRFGAERRERRRRAGGERGRRVGGGRSGPTRAEALRTLGLDADASPDEVKRAYREKVKQTHPDAKSGDEEAFKRVSRAYERLSE